MTITTTFDLDERFNRIVTAVENNDVTLVEALDLLTQLRKEAEHSGLPFDVVEAETRLRTEIGLPTRGDA